jgi:hypothetical protein
LATLIPYLAGEEAAPAAEHALGVIQSAGDDLTTVNFLETVALHLPGEILNKGLAAAMMISDDGFRARSLAALAPRLSGDLKMQAEKAARDFEDQRYRTLVLIALGLDVSEEVPSHDLSTAGTAEDKTVELLFSAQDYERLRSEHRRTAASRLWDELRHQRRQDLLQFCSQPEVFRPTYFSTDTLSRIARDIIDICGKWDWS